MNYCPSPFTYTLPLPASTSIFHRPIGPICLLHSICLLHFICLIRLVCLNCCLRRHAPRVCLIHFICLTHFICLRHSHAFCIPSAIAAAGRCLRAVWPALSSSPVRLPARAFARLSPSVVHVLPGLGASCLPSVVHVLPGLARLFPRPLLFTSCPALARLACPPPLFTSCPALAHLVCPCCLRLVRPWRILLASALRPPSSLTSFPPSCILARF